MTDLDLGECASGSGFGVISFTCASAEANKWILQSDRATANFHPHMLATLDHWRGLQLKCADSPEYRRLLLSCLFNSIERYDS